MTDAAPPGPGEAFDRPAARPLKRPGPLANVMVLLAFCLLIGLGVWQVQRLKWKTALLAHIAALQSAPAEPIGVVLRRAPAGIDVDFTRVETACPEVETTPVLRLYAINQGLAGYRLITACRLADGPYGSILVDRGFIPMPGDDQPRPIPGKSIDVPVVGVLRSPDARTFATAPNQPAANLWYWRDIAGMARTLGAPRPAPVFLMLESPAPADMTPRPAAVPTNIPNNHLGYAITWFGLAAALAGVYLAVLLRRRT
jgi:surfeit locus 1 family protein